MLNTCGICKKKFEATRTIDKYCPWCRDAAYQAKDRARKKKKAAELPPKPWKSQRICEECGAEFMPVQETQVICSSHECKLTRRRKQTAERKRRGLVFKPFRCPVCETLVKPRRRGLKTCGKESCVLAWRNQVAKEWGQKKRAGELRPTGEIGEINQFGEYMMACPFDAMKTGVQGVDSFYSAEMMPII